MDELGEKVGELLTKSRVPVVVALLECVKKHAGLQPPLLKGLRTHFKADKVGLMLRDGIPPGLDEAELPNQRTDPEHRSFIRPGSLQEDSTARCSPG